MKDSILAQIQKLEKESNMCRKSSSLLHHKLKYEMRMSSFMVIIESRINVSIKSLSRIKKLTVNLWSRLLRIHVIQLIYKMTMIKIRTMTMMVKLLNNSSVEWRL